MGPEEVVGWDSAIGPRNANPGYANAGASAEANCWAVSAASPMRWRNNFSRLWVAQMSFHSPATLVRPLNLNLRMLRASLIWPNTGSTVAFLKP